MVVVKDGRMVKGEGESACVEKAGAVVLELVTVMVITTSSYTATRRP